MLRRRLAFILAVLAGFVVGGFGGIVVSRHVSTPDWVGNSFPLPHHVPISQDAAAFRFAMIHDVLHERFPKHGRVFYEAREARAREKVKSLPRDSDEAFSLLDDIAVGQDRLGRPADAVETMRGKFDLQTAKGLNGLDTYTTLANLGTFLVHANMAKALAGDESGRIAVTEGLGHLKKAIRINPSSHFGREKWQVAIIEFLLAVAAKPELLTEFDCFGNRLEYELPSNAFARITRFEKGDRYARPFVHEYLRGGAEQSHAALERAKNHPTGLDQPTTSRFVHGDDPVTDSQSPVTLRQECRRLIARVGAEAGWDTVDVPSHRKPVAFDEPMLGVIGMWRQGGGANPHFALAVGETMLRVGERELAWAAFERTKRLAGRYSQKPESCQFLRDHCDRRQAYIERTLGGGIGEKWRARFDSELAFGEGYQRQMQEHESAKLAAGAGVHDPNLLDDFHHGRPPISTPPGAEEYARVLPYWDGGELGWNALVVLAFGLLGAGLTAVLVTVRFRRRTKPVT